MWLLAICFILGGIELINGWEIPTSGPQSLDSHRFLPDRIKTLANPIRGLI